MNIATLSPDHPPVREVNATDSPVAEMEQSGRLSPWLVFLGTSIAILLLNAAIYAPAISVPFVFDTVFHMQRDLALEQLVAGEHRWLAIASVALDGRLFGNSARGYHFSSVCLHWITSGVVFWMVYESLRCPFVSPGLSKLKLHIAAFTAVLWAVHPLQTLPVLHTTQRTETLMAFFSLTALLFFSLGLKARLSFAYLIASALCYFAATGCKETAIALPVIIGVYDFVFSRSDVASKWYDRLGTILRRRAWYYGALVAISLTFFSSQIIALAKPNQAPEERPAIATESNAQTESAPQKVTSTIYLITETKVIAKYLGLVIFPYPQNFDHGMEISRTVFDKLFYPSLALLFVVSGIWLATRGWAVGFCIVAFFLALAPTSSLIPTREIMAEYRMVLPLAFIIAAGYGGFFVLVSNTRAAIVGGVLVCLVFTGVSVGRVQVYRNGVSLWSDSLAKNSDNPRALAGLARGYSVAKQYQRAIDALNKAIELSNARERVPMQIAVAELRRNLSEVQNNYAVIMTRKKNFTAAMQLLQSATINDPSNAAAHSSLGNAYVGLRDKPRAIASYEAALRIDPNMEAAKRNLATVSASQPPSP